MIFNEFNGVQYYQFNGFTQFNLTHGVFTRHGGVSSAPYKSLNVGGTTGDTRENVIENRRRIFSAVSLPVESIFDVWQVHGNEVIVPSEPRPSGAKHLPADGIVSNDPNITLFMRFADCVPILLYDPQNKVISLAHAGWQGTVKRVVQKTVNVMVNKFQTNPKHVFAGIGPSICKKHYIVGKEVISGVFEQLPEFDEQILQVNGEKAHLDLWKSNELQLRQVGVSNIELSEYCTVCHNKDWYSYRKEGKISGRFGALISLNNRVE